VRVPRPVSKGVSAFPTAQDAQELFHLGSPLPQQFDALGSPHCNPLPVLHPSLPPEAWPPGVLLLRPRAPSRPKMPQTTGGTRGSGQAPG